MNLKNLICSVGLIMTLASGACAQGEFLKNGESGFGASLDFPLGDEAFDVGYNFGYSARNIMDVGLAYADFDELNAKAYAPYITLHFVTPTAEQPFGTAFSVAYEWVSFDDGRTSRSEGTTVLGPTVFANLIPPGTMIVQPSATLAAAIRSDASDDDINLVASVGLALCFNGNGLLRPIGFISHASSSGESQTVFGVGLVAAWK